MGDLSKNFTKKEFACFCGCGSDDIHADLVNGLQEIRTLLGSPIKITSGVRCATHNKSIGGSPHSAHLYGFAADISCTDSSQRFQLLKLIFERFDRVGIAKDFLHVDVDSSKKQEVSWPY